MTPTILIPAAGMGRRMKSFGPKALLPVGGEPLLGRQLRILRAAFPGSEVVVVVGFDGDRIRRMLPAWVRVVVNADYADTNVAHSIALGMQTFPAHAYLIVYGDLVFNRKTIEPFTTARHSSVLTDASGMVRDDEVGVNVVDDHALHFSYGLPTKWVHTMLLTGRERLLFERLASVPANRRYFGYEILNLLLDDDHTSLLALSAPESRVLEIDSSRDLARVPAVLAHGGG